MATLKICWRSREVNERICDLRFANYAPIEYRVAPPRQRMKSKRSILLVAPLVVLLGGLAWLLLPPPDPLFHGKRESEWIKSIACNGDENQTRTLVKVNDQAETIIKVR